MTRLHALHGLHAAADKVGPAPYYWPYNDGWLIGEMAVAGVRAVKIWASTPNEVIAMIRAVLGPDVLIIARLDLDANTDRRVEAVGALVEGVIGDVKRLVEASVTIVEVDNEPNTYHEGCGVHYQDGRQYARWLLAFVQKLRQRAPDAHYVLPALSPGSDEPGVRVDSVMFWDEMVDEGVLEAFESIAMHVYWQSSLGWIGALLDIHKMCRAHRQHLVLVTEYSNPSPDVKAEEKARQYVAFLKAARLLPPNLVALIAFVLWSSAGFEHEVWAGTPIPGIVGSSL